ncbi:hypothetical protein Hanom_Chr12g01139741 [Helianthus anomalus]
MSHYPPLNKLQSPPNYVSHSKIPMIPIIWLLNFLFNNPPRVSWCCCPIHNDGPPFS